MIHFDDFGRVLQRVSSNLLLDALRANLTPYGEVMRWDDLFADLETQLQFGQWEAVEQDAAELTRGVWAELTLMDRLRAAMGQRIQLILRDGNVQAMLLKAVGPTWVGGFDEVSSVLIPRAAIVGVDALLRRAMVPSRPLQSGPSLTSIYRMLARRREPLQVVMTGGTVLGEGTIDRVGKDHIDMALHARDEFRRENAVHGVRIIPFEQIQLVRASPMGFHEVA